MLAIGFSRSTVFSSLTPIEDHRPPLDVGVHVAVLQCVAACCRTDSAFALLLLFYNFSIESEALSLPRVHVSFKNLV